ncbi:flagellar hook-associated protein FlgL [Helicobacter cynogastricus]|uniref:flagellar hook-associated protein FlgL n=1 Tax=Helicobacter cynogastricus TaxID=329937 RepID=UPI000CF09987|nr:flagellar hook-associated protein FlgL [Helicobacter cynogastricus]
MRISDNGRYNQMNYYQNTLQNKLNTANTKIASGLKIQNGYQDSNINNQNLKYGFEENTLDQNIDVAKSAHTSTLNTDKALSELSSTMEQFKTKLIQAANDVHSTTSRQAIALDLEKLKAHMINVANTSIGDEYLFAGSKVDRKPFDSKGNYYGNNENLNALVGANNLVPYNVTGKALFLGKDLDRQKHITSNIKMLNQSKLHPDIMDALNKTAEPKEVFVQADDTLRDLIGDTDDNPSNDPKEYFYLQGVRPDGSAFKAKFALDKAYDKEEDATTIKDLLEQIGKAYGNTSSNKVVDVSLNAWGEIEIKDLTTGNSTIDFHMVSSEKNVDNLADLYTSNARVTHYVKSPFLTDRALSTLRAIPDPYDHRILDLSSAFITQDNTPANRNTKLSEILGPNAASLEISGTRPNHKDGSIDSTPLTPVILDKDASLQDLMDSIKTHFQGNLEVELSEDGRLRLIDKNIKNKEHDSKTPPFDGPHGLSLTLRTLDAKGQEVKALPTDYASEYQKTYFTHSGARLVGNISQVIPKTMEYATGATKLSEVMGTTIGEQSYILKFNDHNGIPLEAKLDLDNKGAFLELPSKSGGAPYKIPLYNRNETAPTLTKPNDFTYRQLMDAITLAMDYSNQDSKLYKQVQASVPSKESKEAFLSLLQGADTRVNVNLDENGKMVIQDKMRSKTLMRFMFFDTKADDFSADTLRKDAPSIRLNANNALTIDQPHINFFKQLDGVIDSVRDGIYRPDALQNNYNEQMRNLGIQNNIELVDHLSDHIEKIIATNGAHSRSFAHILRRNEVLKSQVQSIRGDTVGTDIAETYNKFSQLRNNYDAVLSSSSKINQMALSNYV